MKVLTLWFSIEYSVSLGNESYYWSCFSDPFRSLFSWRLSSYGTCVKFSLLTQHQVETSDTFRNPNSSRPFYPSFSDLILFSCRSRISVAPPAGLGASAQVRCGCKSARGVTERQPRPTSVLLGCGTKRMTLWPPERLNMIIHVLTSVCLSVCVCRSSV